MTRSDLLALCRATETLTERLGLIDSAGLRPTRGYLLDARLAQAELTAAAALVYAEARRR